MDLGILATAVSELPDLTNLSAASPGDGVFRITVTLPLNEPVYVTTLGTVIPEE